MTMEAQKIHRPTGARYVNPALLLIVIIVIIIRWVIHSFW